MKIHLERSEAVAMANSGGVGRVTIPYATPDGEWVQLSYDAVRTQDGKVLVEWDNEHDVWVYEGVAFSDIIIEAEST